MLAPDRRGQAFHCSRAARANACNRHGLWPALHASESGQDSKHSVYHQLRGVALRLRAVSDGNNGNNGKRYVKQTEGGKYYLGGDGVEEGVEPVMKKRGEKKGERRDMDIISSS